MRFLKRGTAAWLRKAGYNGEEEIDWLVAFSALAYNLARLRNLGIIAFR